MGLLSFLVTPSVDTNYSFITGCYLFGVIILAVLFTCEKLFQDVDAIKGMWIIFSPFVPCLIWGAWMRSKWLAIVPKDDKKDSKSKKKD
mmetsp:Transcript_16894/g.24769  ORF Transcript_16894/g.24769 Transcript_16894/m.24769 type:complete len:89 (-) Transcript_16894:205-471(-)